MTFFYLLSSHTPKDFGDFTGVLDWNSEAGALGRILQFAHLLIEIYFLGCSLTSNDTFLNTRKLNAQ